MRNMIVLVGSQSSICQQTMAPKAASISQIPLILCFICLPLSYSIDFSFPAVFNFGDSNSDTGGLVAGMGEHLDPPNGQTYFKNPLGRFCDGRLIIDFLSMLYNLHENFLMYVDYQFQF